MIPRMTRAAGLIAFFQAGFFLIVALSASFIDSPKSYNISAGKIFDPIAFTSKD